MPRPATRFDFRTTLGERDRTVRLAGKVEAFYPAVMFLANGDPGHPDEGGDISELRIFVIHRRGDGREAQRLVPAKSKLYDNDAVNDCVYQYIDGLMGDKWDR
jgi:hypothetical protein